MFVCLFVTKQAAFGPSTITVASLSESAKGFLAFLSNPYLGEGQLLFHPLRFCCSFLTRGHLMPDTGGGEPNLQYTGRAKHPTSVLCQSMLTCAIRADVITYLGQLSDQPTYGRKKLLLLTTIGRNLFFFPDLHTPRSRGHTHPTNHLPTNHRHQSAHIPHNVLI